jgi:hypothetical protein
VHYNFSFKQVKLAVQIFSRSVSIALRICRETNVDGFRDTSGTEEFILLIDTLFDYLNSRNVGSVGFKGPLTRAKLTGYEHLVKRVESELLSLKNAKDVLMYKTRRGTAILGLVASAKSYLSLAKALIYNGDMQYLLAYKFCQDHLELFLMLFEELVSLNIERFHIP